LGKYSPEKEHTSMYIYLSIEDNNLGF
jgi:hypothetical protein